MTVAVLPIRGAVDAVRILQGHRYLIDLAGAGRKVWTVTAPKPKAPAVRMSRAMLLRLAVAVRDGKAVDVWGNPQAEKPLRIPKGSR